MDILTRCLVISVDDCREVSDFCDSVDVIGMLLWLQSINPIIAKKMQEDRGRDYMNARRVVKEYEVVTKGLNKNAASVPPQNTADEVKQVIAVCGWFVLGDISILQMSGFSSQ